MFLKVNLVSEKDGKDTWKCEFCGKKVRAVFNRPMFCVCEREGTILDAWCSPKHVLSCPCCDTQYVEVPQEGHPNSKYWRLKRSDGCLLYACPNGQVDRRGIPRPVERLVGQSGGIE